MRRWQFAGALVALLLAAGKVKGQSADSLQLVQAFQAYQTGRYEVAAAILQPLFEEQPVFQIRPIEGSVAYWLGAAYQAQGAIEEALNTWQQGVHSALTQGAVDVLATDAYVETVFRQACSERFAEAALFYELLLRIAGTPMLPDELQRLRRHVARMIFLLPDTLQRQIWTRDRRFLPDAGMRLMQWWARQDPLPATPLNERIVEHLQRVAYAAKHYASDRTESGLDERGIVYVRLGPPSRIKKLDFYSRELQQALRRLRRSSGNALIVSESDFAPGELWLYDRSVPGGPYYFLFVYDGNLYRQGGVMDLIPPHLRVGLDGDTGRGGAKIDVLLEVLRAVYRQLAPYHLDFSDRYIRVDNYLGQLEEIRIQLERNIGGELYTQDKRSDNSALVQQEGTPFTTEGTPDVFLRSLLAETEREDALNRAEMAARIPRQQSRWLDQKPRLPVVARVARFLRTDGLTENLICWAAPAGALLQDLEASTKPADFLIDLQVVRQRPDYRVAYRTSQLYQIPSRLSEQGPVIPARSVTVPADTGVYHIALQWDQYTLAQREGKWQAGEHLKTSVARFDSLQALRADPAVLEMSDLLPLWYDPATSDTLPGRPYPFARLSPDVPLALYFEVYHLTFGSDDRTRYEVAYEVRRREDGGLLRRDREVQTRSSTVYEGTSRTAREYIVLDLRAWERAKELEVVVRVRDLVSGQEVSRSIRFEVVRS
ncbi:GWxTD domain-containing protein [Rhodothermus marinus]|uniref:GWxTD domain-containing protein n=1 Tax=Rhodothermus marinus TaxID=29549 RepID=UPI0037C8894D